MMTLTSEHYAHRTMELSAELSFTRDSRRKLRDVVFNVFCVPSVRVCKAITVQYYVNTHAYYKYLQIKMASIFVVADALYLAQSSCLYDARRREICAMLP